MEKEKNNYITGEEKSLMDRILGKNASQAQHILISKLKSGKKLSGIEVLAFIEFNTSVEDSLKSDYSLQRDESGNYFYVSNNEIYSIPKQKIDIYRSQIEKLKKKVNITF